MRCYSPLLWTDSTIAGNVLHCWPLHQRRTQCAQLWACPFKASQSDQLPPTKNALCKHIERANYQAAALQAKSQRYGTHQVMGGRLWTNLWQSNGWPRSQHPMSSFFQLVVGAKLAVILTVVHVWEEDCIVQMLVIVVTMETMIWAQFRVVWKMIVRGVMREMNARVVYIYVHVLCWFNLIKSICTYTSQLAQL